MDEMGESLERWKRIQVADVEQSVEDTQFTPKFCYEIDMGDNTFRVMNISDVKKGSTWRKERIISKIINAIYHHKHPY